MDIIPFISMVKKPQDSDCPPTVSSSVDVWDDVLRPEEEANDWCLFTIDVRNTYGIPFEVTLERNQDGSSLGFVITFPIYRSIPGVSSDIVTRLVSPGTTLK